MYSNDIKIRAITLYNKFKNYRNIAKLLDISKSTIHRWVNNITQHRQINNIDFIIKFVKCVIDRNKFITIKQIVCKIKNKFNKTYSQSFIYTIIKKTLNYSFKKINNKNFNKSINDLKMKHNIFKKQIKNINTNNIICIDETYIHSNYSPNYGWSKKGTRLFHYKKSNPIKYSILMAISNNGIVKYDIYKENINTFIFKNFVNTLNNLYSNHYFLMDNVSFHKSREITSIFYNSSNELLFIPPYSPQFNPIEFVFSQMKQNLNVYTKDIHKNIKNSLSKINAIHLMNYYNNCLILL